MGTEGRRESFGRLEDLGGFEREASDEEMRRLEGEKVTVADILGGEKGWAAMADEEEEEEDGDLGFGAKNREITCCFCFLMRILQTGKIRVTSNNMHTQRRRSQALARFFVVSTLHSPERRVLGKWEYLF